MMQDPTRHPDDERLSALAAGDADAVDAATLREHVADCPRCTTVVGELLSLRAALAQLPDVAPPRPLRLLPPAAEPAPRRGFAAFAHLLGVPALAAGIILAVAGGIGSYGTLLGGAAGTSLNAGGGQPAVAPAEQAQPSQDRFSAAPGDTSDNGSREDGRASVTTPANVLVELPWPTVLVAGVVLLVVGLYLRFAVQPRAP